MKQIPIILRLHQLSRLDNYYCFLLWHSRSCVSFLISYLCLDGRFASQFHCVCLCLLLPGFCSFCLSVHLGFWLPSCQIIIPSLLWQNWGYLVLSMQLFKMIIFLERITVTNEHFQCKSIYFKVCEFDWTVHGIQDCEQRKEKIVKNKKVWNSW